MISLARDLASGRVELDDDGSAGHAFPHWWPLRLEAIGQLAAWARGGSPPDWPLEVFLEISNVCDLKCAMCPTFSGLSPNRLFSIKENERGFIDGERVLEALEPVLRRALVVHCFGDGEPTLHPGFAALLARLRPYRLRVDVFTNGMHLDQAFCELLLRNRVAAITVSFSGADQTAYENIYQGGHFERVLAGLTRLAALKEQVGSRYPRVEINSLGFDHHVARLPEFVDLMADHGVDVIHLKALQTFEVTKELLGHRSLPRPWVEGLAIARARERAAARGLILSADQYWETRVEDQAAWEAARGDTSATVPLEDLSAYASAVTPGRPPPVHGGAPQVNAARLDVEACASALDFADYQGDEPFYCFEPFKTLYVRRSGDVKPCCFAHNGGPTLGQLGEAPVQAIWRGAPWRALREGILAQRYPQALCRDCLRDRYGPRIHDLPQQLAAYGHWLADVWGQELDLGLSIPTLSNTEIVLRARGQADYMNCLEEIRRLLPFGVPRRLLQGHLDGVRDGFLHGWLWSPERPELRLRVALVYDGAPWQLRDADEQRDDLRAAGIGDGRYGFAVELPPDAGGATVEAYLAETDWLLGRVAIARGQASEHEPADCGRNLIAETAGEHLDDEPGLASPPRGSLADPVSGFQDVPSQPALREFPLDYDPGIHEIELLRFFSRFIDDRVPAQPPAPELTAWPVLIIVFCNRSGSHLLTQALAATGLVHNAGECFNYDEVQDCCTRMGIRDLDGYLKHLATEAMARQSTLAVKLSWDQLYFLTRFGVIPHYWRRPRFVWSLREDLLAQALSLLVATRTQCWTGSYPAVALDALLEQVSPQDLANCVQQIGHAQSQARNYFAIHGISPVLVEYRELARAPEEEARRVLDALELIPAGWRWRFDPEAIRVRRQRTPAMERRLAQLRQQLRL